MACACASGCSDPYFTVTLVFAVSVSPLALFAVNVYAVVRRGCRSMQRLSEGFHGPRPGSITTDAALDTP